MWWVRFCLFFFFLVAIGFCIKKPMIEKALEVHEAL